MVCGRKVIGQYLSRIKAHVQHMPSPPPLTGTPTPVCFICSRAFLSGKSMEEEIFSFPT